MTKSQSTHAILMLGMSAVMVVLWACGNDSDPSPSANRSDNAGEADHPAPPPDTGNGSGEATALPGQGDAIGQQDDAAAPAAMPSVAQPSTNLTEEMALVDEARDDWPTEVLNSAAGKVLKEVAHVVEAGVNAQALVALVSEQFACQPLIPDSLPVAFERDGLQVLSGEIGTGEFRAAEGLAAALGSLTEPFDLTHLHFKFKIDRVDVLADNEASTSVIYLAMGEGPDGVIQQNARWEVRWDTSAGLDHPRLLGIEVSDFNQVVAPRKLFVDCTGSVLEQTGVIPYLSRGIDYWWGKVDTALGISLYGGYGIALGDINNDGLDDLYVCRPGGLPNLLLQHNPDGTLTNISRGSGIDLLNDTINALFADLDNDGNQDIIVVMGTHIALMRGDGQGRFTPRGALTAANPVGVSAADYDGDSLLDLYLCRYGEDRGRGGSDSIFDSNLGIPNILFRNEGGFSFRDVTKVTGIDQNNRRFSFSSVWEDYDNDGDLDLYVANDFGRNNLYNNDGGVFTDVAGEAGVEDQAAGMGASWTDFNHDGLMDLYVSNMFSSAGGRVSFQRNYAPGGDESAASEAQYFTRGNSLFQNLGNGTFRDVSDTAGVSMGRWAWGAEFADLNGDGDDDIVVPNGYITNHNSKDL